eukprot:211205-Rhodomonas_salina.2
MDRLLFQPEQPIRPLAALDAASAVKEQHPKCVMDEAAATRGPGCLPEPLIGAVILPVLKSVLDLPSALLAKRPRPLHPCLDDAFAENHAP